LFTIAACDDRKYWNGPTGDPSVRLLLFSHILSLIVENKTLFHYLMNACNIAIGANS